MAIHYCRKHQLLLLVLYLPPRELLCPSRHIESKGHQAKQQALKSASTVKDFYLPVTAEMSVQEVKTRRAEVKVAIAMVQHNVPFAVADHFSPLYRECFKDSPTAQNFKSASTKTVCIINEAVAPHYMNELVTKMRENPFTLLTDGSNDTGLEKMNPLTVRIFDTTKVVHRFLDMCTTSGRSCGTADVIYKKINDVLVEYNIPWKNCVGLSVDNAAVNIGSKNSIGAKLLRENPSIYIHGCPCHIIHNTAKKAGQSFLEISGFDPEDLVVDVGYWFKGSTNRKGYLKEFCEFHGSEYMAMLLHVSVRWFSLEMCITRILQQYGPLTSYFKSARYVYETPITNSLFADEKQPRFRRLVEAFSNPLTEVYLLFLQATLPVFSTLNLLQREKASIFQLYEEEIHQETLFEVHETNSAMRGRKKLNVGFTTRATLNRLLEAGDVTSQKAKEFQQAAPAFLVKAVEYAIAKLPLTDPLLKHARFVDVQLRAECAVEDALYFVDRQGFQGLLPYLDPKEQDQISEEFMDYQLMDIAIPEDPTSFDAEEFWGKMSSTKNKVTGLNQFGKLSKIATLVLVLPHSNADAERVFSMVGLNKTTTRNSLALNGTLSSIMTLKMAGLEPNCFKWEPIPKMIKESKKATNTYNQKHQS
ncbi:Protein FAM200B [Merluccius polli]|uniref:Protein FAM200B n=1 Tax=Merluccius polli TaxID=89951 RepID=A0AA47N6D9_MERPO|nr:Protein FAM200B [Merluccius polli]